MLRAIGLALSLVASAFIVGVSQPVDQDLIPSTQGRANQMNDSALNKAIIRSLFEEWVNKKNLAAIDEMVTANYVSHEGGKDTNAEDTKKFLAGVFGSFPDMYVEIQDIVSEGDKVVVRNIWRGTDKGGFMGMAPTGRKVFLEGIVIWRTGSGLRYRIAHRSPFGKA